VPSGGAANVEFVGIPSGYKHLQIRIMARTNRASVYDQPDIRFNSDATSGNYYVAHQLGADGSGIGTNAGGTGTRLSFQRLSGNTAGANMYGAMIIDILDYTSTVKHKTVRAFAGTDQRGSGELYFSSGLWFPSTVSAITSITITPNTGPNWLVNSSFALYGVK
jgi:hypothetical protein